MQRPDPLILNERRTLLQEILILLPIIIDSILLRCPLVISDFSDTDKSLMRAKIDYPTSAIAQMLTRKKTRSMSLFGNPIIQNKRGPNLAHGLRPRA